MNTKLIRSLACLCVNLCLVVAGAHSADKPNLLIIHTDEHNFRTLGCYRALMPKEQAFIWGDGVAVETPHIDSLAKRGAICDRFYAASPVCTPSRASFLTGRYPQNTGAPINDLPMRDDMVTFAEVLRAQRLRDGLCRQVACGRPGASRLDAQAQVWLRGQPLHVQSRPLETTRRHAQRPGGEGPERQRRARPTTSPGRTRIRSPRIFSRTRPWHSSRRTGAGRSVSCSASPIRTGRTRCARLTTRCSRI